MHRTTGNGSRSRLLSVHFLGLTITWAAVVIVLAVWDLSQIRQTQLEMCRNEARAYFNKDHSLRLWAASHGGVYVPVSERTPPNPYLDQVPERDITTPGGASLTLMNPAYVIRQVMTDYGRNYGIRGHITSLKNIRPETAPDEWERLALQRFEHGLPEISESAEIDGQPCIRLMRPIYTSEECLSCHARQGYKVGDVRGGISISVPMAPYLSTARKQMWVHGISLGALLFGGLFVIGLVRRSLMREMRERDQAEADLKAARDALEERTSELRSANSEVQEHAARLEFLNQELEEFAFIASHDLQEPLRKIRAFGDRLRARCQTRLDPTEIDYLTRMEGAAGRMQQLISDLLKYSRVTSLNQPFSPVDLNEVVEEVRETFQYGLNREGGKIEFSGLPVIEADETQMRQLFQNLIGNALKYKKDTESPCIKLYTNFPDSSVCRILVEDNGIGFDEKYLDRIFAPFQRLHGQGKYEGTGMGLAICRKIVERHGGNITARSRPGEGAVFIVTLPCSRQRDDAGD